RDRSDPRRVPRARHRRRGRRRRLARRDHRAHHGGPRRARHLGLIVGLRRSLYKTPAQLRAMVEPGLITAAALDAVRALIAPGVTTGELDAAAADVIRSRGAESNFQL